MPSDYLIRAPFDTDSLEELTGLLNRAYKQLADRGFNYLATHQGPEITAERIANGSCFVGFLSGRLVSTITLYDAAATGGCEWYDRDDVAHFGQFAVEPALQRRGLGGQTMDFIEELASKGGITELALDTAERAHHLIHFYERRGYRQVGNADWAADDELSESGVEQTTVQEAVIRAATTADALGIATVQIRSWKVAYRGIIADSYLDSLDIEVRAQKHRERLAQPADSRPLIRVAEVKPSGLVGFVNGGAPRVEVEGFDCEMFALYLLPDWWRRGIGRRLAGALAAGLRDRAYRSMLVRVLTENHTARRFYEALGGQYVSEQPRVIGGAEYAEISYGWPDLSSLGE